NDFGWRKVGHKCSRSVAMGRRQINAESYAIACFAQLRRSHRSSEVDPNFPNDFLLLTTWNVASGRGLWTRHPCFASIALKIASRLFSAEGWDGVGLSTLRK